jgi:hypothetical protein
MSPQGHAQLAHRNVQPHVLLVQGVHHAYQGISLTQVLAHHAHPTASHAHLDLFAPIVTLDTMSPQDHAHHAHRNVQPHVPPQLQGVHHVSQGTLSTQDRAQHAQLTVNHAHPQQFAQLVTQGTG